MPAALLPLPRSPFLWTFGFTLLFLGFGAFLLLVMHHGLPGRWLRPLWRAAGWVGFYSYSIYLWHWMARNVVIGQLLEKHRVPWWLAVLAYLAAAIGTGALLGRLVEVPFLKIRDRFFPSRSQPDPSLTQTNPIAAGERAA